MRTLFIAVCVLLAPLAPASAQVPDSFLRRIGMESAWKSQLQLPRFGRGLVSTHVWVDPAASREFAVVELPERSIRIPADSPDRNGKPIGMEEAQKRAQEYASRLADVKGKVEVKKVTVPSVKIITTTSDGLVQAADGETGQLLWSSPCGHTGAPAYPAAVSSAGIAVIHGLRLYVLDWKTGKHLYSTELKNPSSNAIATVGNLAFVADIRGRVESYGLTGPVDEPYGYVITGRVIGEPVSLANGLYSAMASDAGYVYVFAGGEEPTEWIRYESSNRISGSLGAGNNAFYVANVKGILSKITVADRLGQIEWEYHSGHMTTAPPLVLGDTVYIASESGDVSAVADSNGIARWTSPRNRIAQPIGKCGNQVFAISNTGELISMDGDTGAPIARSQSMRLAKPVLNQHTDRIYLITATGVLQCIRAKGAELPTLIQPSAPPTADGQEAEANSTPFANSETSTDQGNPFNAGGTDTMGEDPFGGTGGSNPFGGSGGGGDDPFGGSGGSGSSDPFGGSGTSGGDPFGTGGSSTTDDPFGTSGDSPF